MTDEELAAIAARCEAVSPGPWVSSVEGRDHESGDDVILVARGTGLDEEDIYVSRDFSKTSVADLDFIAHARQDVPALLAEVLRLRCRSD